MFTMSKNKKLQKIIDQSITNSSGFTLTELLVAITITGILVAGGGSILTNVLQARADLEQESARRKASSRALDFISEEIKSASEIESSPSKPSDYSSPPDSSSNELVIVANLPNLSQNVVYSIATPNNANPWRGPNIIYRWGPNETENDGTYTYPNSPSEWETKPLIDFVTDGDQDDTKVDSYTSKSDYCKDSADTILANNPPTRGFYLCLNDGSNKTGEVVIRTQPDENLNDVENVIQVTTKVFARSD